MPARRSTWCRSTSAAARRDPELSKFGGIDLAASERNASRRPSVDLASDMIDLQAQRSAREPGIRLSARDTALAAPSSRRPFPTRKRRTSSRPIEAIKRDMDAARPMDRLICGDVGYGKTELAMRAAFKAVDNGKQVAVLVPTTVLAEQHYRTFSQRLAEYPFVVEVRQPLPVARPSRSEIVEAAGEGGVDIIIGTHRLVQRRTCSSRTWGWSSSTRSSASASSTRNGSSTCGRWSTC